MQWGTRFDVLIASSPDKQWITWCKLHILGHKLTALDLMKVVIPEISELDGRLSLIYSTGGEIMRWESLKPLTQDQWYRIIVYIVGYGMRSGLTTPRDSVRLYPRHRHPLSGVTLLRTARVRLNRLRSGVERLRSCLHKRGMVSSAACECGAEEQTVDHVVFVCLIHRPPHGLHYLTVLDGETIEWLLNICSEM